MSPSTRMSFLMLGACLFPLGAHAAPVVDEGAWYFGSATEPATEEVPADYWLVNYDDVTTLARAPKKKKKTTTPPPKPKDDDNPY